MKQNVLFVSFPTLPLDMLEDHIAGKSTRSAQTHGEPLGILHLSSYLKKYGQVQNVAILDFVTTLLKTKRFKNIHDFISTTTEKTVKFTPDIIACSINFTPSHPFMIKCIEHFKSKWKKSVVIVGGNHATNGTTRLLQIDSIDYVARGEAEVAFTDFVNQIAQNKKVSVKGIYSKKDLPNREKDGVIPRWIIGDGTIPDKNSDHILDLCKGMENMDELPYPDWGLLDMETYSTEIGRALYIGAAVDKKKASLFTSRGCPFRCTFCATFTTFTRLLKYHSPQYIVGQINYLNKKYGITTFIIEDDLFTGNKEKVIEMLSAFKNLKIPNFQLQFPNALSINTLNKTVVDALIDTGMKDTELAVESGSSYVQKNIIHKNVNLDMVKHWVDYLKSRNVVVRLLFILGFPNETKEQMRETINFAKSTGADWCIFNIAIPLIGTEMYEEFLMKGVIKEDLDWLAKTDFSRRTFDTNEISAQELNDLEYGANLDVNFLNNPNLIAKNYKIALQLYDSVLAKYSWHIVALYCKKRCHEGLGEFDEAEKVMQKIETILETDLLAQNMYRKYSDLMPDLYLNKQKMKIPK